VSNNLEDLEGAHRTDGRLSGFDQGRFICSGSVTVRFGQDTTLDGIADGIATAALVFLFTGQGGTNFLKFEIPAAKLDSHPCRSTAPAAFRSRITGLLKTTR